MPGNKNLYSSRGDKADEFYTQLSLIENELRHYRGHFKGKTVLCNCDDPYESNFFKYFAINFNFLGLKKLIATCYIGSPIANMQLSLFDYEEEDEKTTKSPHIIEVVEVDDYNEDGAVNLADVEYLIRNKENVLTKLKGDGDFRSKECIAFLKQADIVVTNPPFSLFREYIAQLFEYKKSFIIIGNQNAVTYKELFPLLKNNLMWLGTVSGHFWFKVPDTYEEKATDFKVDENGQKWRRMGNICWFTNLDIKKRHEDMILFRAYSPELYPTYDNYDAIEVSKTADIPCDYFGVMGVPITFMDKYNPKQFEIVGISTNDKDNLWGIKTKSYTLQDAKNYTVLNAASVLKIDGKLKAMYARVLIRRKQANE
jgi:hypothetical protein